MYLGSLKAQSHLNQRETTISLLYHLQVASRVRGQLFFLMAMNKFFHYATFNGHVIYFIF